jgi:hypothetical protein
VCCDRSCPTLCGQNICHSATLAQGGDACWEIGKRRRIFRAIENYPFICSKELLVEAGVECSECTLRFLKKEGIQYFKALRRPKLTPEAAAKRLAFAN